MAVRNGPPEEEAWKYVPRGRMVLRAMGSVRRPAEGSVSGDDRRSVSAGPGRRQDGQVTGVRKEGA